MLLSVLSPIPERCGGGGGLLVLWKLDVEDSELGPLWVPGLTGASQSLLKEKVLPLMILQSN